MIDTLVLAATGVFTVGLGVVHFAMPALFDFRTAIPLEGVALRPVRVGPVAYRTTRGDVRGIAWVMNHAASYGLVMVGFCDLGWAAARDWAGPTTEPLALAIAGWWSVRAASQLYLGRRALDWIFLVFFSALGALHLAIVLA
jgi:hypothetical protein